MKGISSAPHLFSDQLLNSLPMQVEIYFFNVQLVYVQQQMCHLENSFDSEVREDKQESLSVTFEVTQCHCRNSKIINRNILHCRNNENQW